MQMRQTGVVGEVLCPVLVGRRAEIQALESALAGALSGCGGCVVTTGKARHRQVPPDAELARVAACLQVPVGIGLAVRTSVSAP